MENFVPLPYGGATRRPAIQYLGDAKAYDFALQSNGTDDYVDIGSYTLNDLDITVEFKGENPASGVVLGSLNTGEEIRVTVNTTDIRVIIGDSTDYVDVPYTVGDNAKIRLKSNGDVYSDDVLVGNTNPSISFTLTNNIALYARYNAFGGGNYDSNGSPIIKRVTINGNEIYAVSDGYFTNGTTDYFNKGASSNSSPLTNVAWGVSEYDKIRLIPFTASVGASYCIELGNQYIRFWKDGALIEESSVPVEVGSPWNDTELNDIKFAQSVDVMWLVHPNHAPQRISRFSDTSWTISDEQFDYPPLMDGNDTDITMSPSATTGTITLTSSQDFFNEGHVGGYMSFSSPRLSGNRSASDKLTATGVSEELYVSNANWEVSTSDNWAGLLILQRSLDGGTTWEDYVTIGDTTGAAATGYKNFSISSDGAEPISSRIRLQWIRSAGDLQYLIKTDDEWNTLVKITGYTDSKTVTAEVVDEFQDTTTDYSAWSVSGTPTGVAGNYDIGDKVVIDGGITYATNNVNLVTEVDAGLTDIVGSDFGGGYFWFVTNGASNKKIYKVNSSLTSLEASYDISSYFSDGVGDIAYYSNDLYVTGRNSTFFDVKKFNSSGVFNSTVLTENYAPTQSTDNMIGIGYYNNFFYIGIKSTVKPLGSDFTYYILRKYTTGFSYSGTELSDFVSGISGRYDYNDITGVDGKLYIADDFSNSINSFNQSLSALGSQDISTQTTNPQGIAWDGSSLWVVDGGGVIYEYNLISSTSYYECVEGHTPSTFSTDLSNGYWALRTPEMTTWTEGAFSDYRGHPVSIALFESRLCYGGTATCLSRAFVMVGPRLSLTQYGYPRLMITPISRQVHSIRIQ
jgi:hypothetical protein